MINPHELRVGNYISHKVPSVKGGVRIFRIRGIITNEYGRAMVYTYLDNPPKSNEYMASDYVENFEPIELTPELMGKFGFKGWKRQVSMNMGYEGGDMFFGIPDGDESFRGGNYQQTKYKHDFILGFVFKNRALKQGEGTFWYGRGGSKKGLEIKYLHQMQNLYFALSGGEVLPITFE